MCYYMFYEYTVLLFTQGGEAMSVKILAVGDVCGEPGLSFLNNNLRSYRKERGIDFVVVNGENANVVGITPKQADVILHAGADVVTLGNHTWTRTELRPYLEERRRILRPANFAPQCPGKGIEVYPTDFGDVCVPHTALARPSSRKPIARFSLVPSAWKSTRMIFSRISSIKPSAMTKGLSVLTSSVKRPIRLSTHTSPKSVG